MIHPDATELSDVLTGLAKKAPRLSPKYFYGGDGSRLFEEITRTQEYYLTRTELAILRRHGRIIAERVAPGSALIELGSGSADKALELLRHLRTPRVYRPIDISRDALERTTESVRRSCPQLTVSPHWGDFAAEAGYAELPECTERLLYYSGSTIGNFEPKEALALLRFLRSMLRPGERLLLAADLVKDPAILHAAYNDRRGVTAAFNKNALSTLNRRFGANFDLSAFTHLAFYDVRKRRVEMHLVPERRMEVLIAGQTLYFDPAEPIHTENSYKFTRDDLQSLAANSGFTLEDIITDERAWFAEALLRA